MINKLKIISATVMILLVTSTIYVVAHPAQAYTNTYNIEQSSYSILLNKIQSLFKIMEEFTILIKEYGSKLNSTDIVYPVKPIKPTNHVVDPIPINNGYLIDDVKYVTVSYISSLDLDGGYYIYYIYLSSGNAFKVEVHEMQEWITTEKSFYNTGFKGDVKKLMALVKNKNQ